MLKELLTDTQIAEGSGRALEFSRHYGARAHQTQRSGPVPGSMPSVAECDELMSYQQRVLDSMQSIKEVIIAQQQALAEQRTYEHTYKAASEADEDGANFHEKLEGAGGFAGADAKKRRGVRERIPTILPVLTMERRGLLLQGVVIAAIELKRRNGVEVQMVPELYATLADYVSLTHDSHVLRWRRTDNRIRLCQIDPQEWHEAFSDLL